MRNADKHELFADADVRDFLSQQLGFSYPGEVAHLQKQIADLTERLSAAKKAEAAMTLIIEKGWRDHDVSDLITDYDANNYFSFVGTDDELKLALGNDHVA